MVLDHPDSLFHNETSAAHSAPVAHPYLAAATLAIAIFLAADSDAIPVFPVNGLVVVIPAWVLAGTEYALGAVCIASSAVLGIGWPLMTSRSTVVQL